MKSLFCKHDYNLVNQFEMKSEFDTVIEMGKIPNTWDSRTRLVVTDYKCSKCPKIKRLTAIKNNLESTNDKLKEAVSFAMQSYGIFEVKTPTLKLSFRQSESVQIENESLLDGKYFNYKPTVDKTAIKNDIKSGLIVNGASIVKKQNLQVK